jgi:hypothetical protein
VGPCLVQCSEHFHFHDLGWLLLVAFLSCLIRVYYIALGYTWWKSSFPAVLSIVACLFIAMETSYVCLPA